MNTLDRTIPDAASGSLAATRPQRLPGRRPGWRAWWAPRWPGAVAALLGAALLLTFVQVVIANVQRGESRNRAAAARAERVWRCNILPLAAQRASCRAQLAAETSAATAP